MWYDVKRQFMLFHKRIQQTPLRHGLMLTVCVFVLYICVFSGDSKLKLPGGVNLSKYEPFEPVALTDFGEGSREVGEEKIPKIIHWVSPTSYIPKMYVLNMKTFMKHHPDWTFYLWTEENSRNLIKESLPALLKLWDDHTHFKHLFSRRFELIRYIVLYLYGGVFVELSARNYRSLDSAISKYSCIIPPNPYEEAILTGVPYTVTNRVMLCRQKHPFFKLVVENLHRYQHMSSSFDAVGEGFFMTHYQLYNGLQRERDDRNIYIQRKRKQVTDADPYFFQGELSKAHKDAVYVPNSVYFNGNSDPKYHSTYIKTCKKLFESPFLHQRACVHLHHRGLKIQPSKFTYIDLHNSESSIFMFSSLDVKSLNPNIIVYGHA